MPLWALSGQPEGHDHSAHGGADAKGIGKQISHNLEQIIFGNLPMGCGIIVGYRQLDAGRQCAWLKEGSQTLRQFLE